MQGRLSPLVGGKIQAFPFDHWQEEFAMAKSIDISLMEWTLDCDRLYENPLLTPHGQQRIRSLCQTYQLMIPSLTGDCFMQAPFWKASRQHRKKLHTDFIEVAKACSAVNINLIVVPLVDNGSLENNIQEEQLIAFMLDHVDLFRALDLNIIFESDFPPSRLYHLIRKLDAPLFGINYDIGNSAALGFNPVDEFDAYGSRILNVHVKDRLLRGTTVPLGTGNADFITVFRLLSDCSYTGSYIMQTARAEDDDHLYILDHYKHLIEGWLASISHSI